MGLAALISLGLCLFCTGVKLGVGVGRGEHLLHPCFLLSAEVHVCVCMCSHRCVHVGVYAYVDRHMCVAL